MVQQQKIVVDCTAPGGTAAVASLTAAEQAAYDAQQPIGQQAVAAIAAAAALRVQHLQALAAIKAALTANGATTANDITAIQNLIASIQAGTQPTGAQVLQVLRFLLRTLAALEA